MICSNEPLDPLPDWDCAVPTSLGQGEANYSRVYNAMCGLHYSRFNRQDKEAAKSFAHRFLQVWQSGGIRPLFKDVVDCATKVIELLESNPKASISAHNIRLIAGQKPKFSQRIRAKL